MIDFSDPIILTQKLVQIPSITPDQGAGVDLLDIWLTALGFTTKRFSFGEGEEKVDNLYARYYRKTGKTDAPCLAFAGHSDVVPVGDGQAWQCDPFAAIIKDGELIGRGTADMKGAIAAFIAAFAQLKMKKFDFPTDIALLITGDEEGPSINGMNPLLKALHEQGECWSACITGEPTNPDYIGQMMKIGRRGSLHGHLQVLGKQGHTGYPARADNAAHRLIALCHALLSMELDKGSDYFEPSNLAFSTLDIGNAGRNIIPGKAEAHFNIRFNDLHQGTSLIKRIEGVLQATDPNQSYQLDCKISGESFLTEAGLLSDAIANACHKICGHRPQLSTSGGTSDSRFIKDYCPVVDFGLVGRSMHMVNESITLEELHSLTAIYKEVITHFKPN